jgi:hypothetical protein
MTRTSRVRFPPRDLPAGKLRLKVDCLQTTQSFRCEQLALVVARGTCLA